MKFKLKLFIVVFLLKDAPFYFETRLKSNFKGGRVFEAIPLKDLKTSAFAHFIRYKYLDSLEYL